MPENAASSAVQHPGVFTCALPMRWGDMDALGHMNNAVYFRFFEEARVRLLAHLSGFGPGAATNEPGRVSVLAHTSCDFLKPVIYPATLLITQSLIRLGRTSLEMRIEMQRDDEPGVVYAKGRYVVVGADASTGRPVPWSDQQIETLRHVFHAPA